MRSATLQKLIEGVERLDVADSVKHQVRQLVYEICAPHGHAAFDRAARVAYARRLLDMQTSRPTIRDRLIACYQVSRRQAYRIIDDALKVCRKPSKNGTANRLNAGAAIFIGGEDDDFR
jgi:hypothetical protein